MDLGRPPALTCARANETLAGYKVVRSLGEGGFGSVFEALRQATGERVALKELSRQHPDALARFKQEFRAMQDLHHPNLVELQELFEVDGRWFIAMGLVQGTDWLSWVRRPTANDNGAPFDAERIRASLVHIAAGLDALHRAGFVHCDLKPSNIQVTPSGHAVLLDFGLVTPLDFAAQLGDSAAGSVRYMAPEQAAGQGVGPKADWYAVGVCLYEALTGQAPFTGPTALSVMQAKQGRPPPPPSAHCPQVPSDLDSLTSALLAPGPQGRAGGAEVARALSAQSAPGPQTALAPTMGAPFTGRRRELDALGRALDEALGGAARQVILEGESGVGKSALVEEFLRRQREDHPAALVLRGRCYENEDVPFKGLDGVMDAVTRHLRALAEPACEHLLPPRARVLQQLFPVLGAVQPLARLPAQRLPAEPSARRAVAVDALRELFTALRRRQPVVVVVDDVQWADAESFALLDALTAHPDRPPLLMVFTVRPQAEISPALREPLRALRQGPDAQVLPLRGLGEEDARALVLELFGEGVPPAWIDQVVRESEGHPLFVAELVRYAKLGYSRFELDGLTLDAVLAARVEALAPRERGLLRVVALATSPKPRDVLFAAAPCEVDSGALAALRAARLVRMGQRGLVQCYHDRVRRAVIDGLDRYAAAPLHAALGRALAATRQPDPAEVGYHLSAAGKPEEALAWLERAADRALENLSFARAERLYAQCLKLGGAHLDEATRCRLQTGQGHALARGGRSAEAAEAYRAAAALADREQAVRLRVWAAQHLLQSAQVQRGLALAREALAEVGVDIPSSSGAALRRLVWDRARLSFRGLDVAPRDPTTIPGAVRRRLDALQALSIPVGVASFLPGLTLTARHVLYALDAGEAGHASRALSGEGAGLTMQSPEQFERHVLLLRRAEQLARQTGAPVDRAVVMCNQGTAHFFRGALRAAQARLGETEDFMVERCAGEPFLLWHVRTLRGTVWQTLGQHAALADASEHWLEDARRRGDAAARAGLVGLGGGYLRHLRADQPDRALAELEEAMAPWPDDPFSVVHWGQMLGTAVIGAYLGGATAWRWFERNGDRLQRAFVLKHGMGKESLRINRVVAMLAAGAARGTPRERRELAKHVRWLTRRTSPFALGYGLMLDAQLKALGGQIEGARQAAIQAENFLATTEQEQLQLGVRYLMGLLEGGRAGRAKRDAVLQRLSDEGYVRPARALRIFGLPDIDALQAALLGGGVPRARG